MSRRVVITGVGPLSALGAGRADFTAALKEARSGIAEITLFDPSALASWQAAEVGNFDVQKYMDSRKTYLDRSSEFALAAVRLALDDAALRRDALADAALIMGTAYGSFDTMALFMADLFAKGPRLVKPFLFPHTYANTAISLAAIEYGIRGYHNCFSSGCTSAAYAILEAFDRIRQGRTTLALAGGADALGETLFTSLSAGGRLSAAGGARGEVMAPFDAARNGCILGEGGCMLVLEEYEHARARGAHIHAELVGAGAAGGTAEADGLARAMRGALRDAGADFAAELVLSSANGDVIMDRSEARAIRETAPGAPVVTSIKPLIGETLGASGAFQVAAACAVLDTASVPPILNLECVEDGLDIRAATGQGVAHFAGGILTNILDPGGSAVCFAVRHVGENA